ncbi:hypothetical protein [Nonomuraea sp. NPDC050310]|uniref:hypothetical protein n=1 Tax=Nonomuraea sp. NPDC050310 TaxID=3154935 RepID=UPI00340F9A81
MRHTITVQPYIGSGPGGRVFGAPVTYRAYVQDKRQLVRNAAGQEVVSEATAYVGDPAANIPADSKVTVPAGRTALVITANRREGALHALRDHLEITLT